MNILNHQHAPTSREQFVALNTLSPETFAGITEACEQWRIGSHHIMTIPNHIEELKAAGLLLNPDAKCAVGPNDISRGVQATILEVFAARKIAAPLEQ